MTGTIAAADIRIDVAGIDPDKARAILTARAATLQALAAPAVEPGPAMLAWRLGGERFALPLAKVATVLAPLSITPVPGAGAALIGIAYLRGELVNVIDPAGALGVEKAGGDGHLLLLRRPGPRIAMRVDRCLGVVRLASVPGTGEGLSVHAEDETGDALSVVDGERMIAALGFGARPADLGD